MALSRRDDAFALGGTSGSVRITHLFSAPLTKAGTLIEGSGMRIEPVAELSYQGERDTLIRAFQQSGKSIRFVSEAANTESFARAVGCCTRERSSTGGTNGSISVSHSSTRASRAPDSECRILHFTGHGVKGSLTFEDRYGRLQYKSCKELLQLLRCQSSRVNKQYRTFGSCCTPSRSAAVTRETLWDPVEQSEDDLNSSGYAPFEDLTDSIPDLEYVEGSGWTGFAAGNRDESSGGRPSNTLEKGVPRRNGLQLVFLSSCHSASVAHCFIQAGVRHVVAVKASEQVLDHKAHEFAQSFYTALLRGDTVRQAFILGSNRLGVSIDRPEECKKFVLLPTPEDGGNHDIPVFEEVPVGRFVDATPVKPDYRGYSVTGYFCGREVEVQKVVQHMVEGVKCITIRGQKGIGKTQVLRKACKYTSERNVFDDIFICAVERNDDARLWLERGFKLHPRTLEGRAIEGAVDILKAHVNARIAKRKQRGHQGSGRVLLVLDGCEGSLFVGQQRQSLDDVLSRLFRELPNLTAAVTMRSTEMEARRPYTVRGEKAVHVKGLEARRTAELFIKCCPHRLETNEINPSGESDNVGAFARSEIIQALKGHPGCVEALCGIVGDGRHLVRDRNQILNDEIPKVRRTFSTRRPPTRCKPPVAIPVAPVTHHLRGTPGSLEEFWWSVSRTTSGYFATPKVTWGRLCRGLQRVFLEEVPGARERPLSESDFIFLARDTTIWGQGQNPPADMAASQQIVNVASVEITREEFELFWRWFWEAITSLKLTGAWTIGVGRLMPGFAGFVGKTDAQERLSGSSPGTFLIRFSSSQPGALAVHFTVSRGPVKSVIIDVHGDGRLSFNSGTDDRQCGGLEDLALKEPRLVYLYPNIPKEHVFARHPARRASLSQPNYDMHVIRRRASLPLPTGGP